jgi:hypothetical protein
MGEGEERDTAHHIAEQRGEGERPSSIRDQRSEVIKVVINQKVVVIAATTSASRPAGDPTFLFYHQFDSRLDPLGIEKERNIPPPSCFVDNIYQNVCIDSGTARHLALLACTKFRLNQPRQSVRQRR